MALAACRVVLVRPRIAANIGATARVMRNLGYSELVLVAPEADPEDPRGLLLAQITLIFLVVLTWFFAVAAGNDFRATGEATNLFPLPFVYREVWPGSENLPHLLAFALIAICGMIGQYNVTERPSGPRNMFMIVTKSLRLQGFILSNYLNLRPAFDKDLAAWYAAGKIKSRETVFQGIEQAPNAFLGLFKGANTGKMLVKL